MSIVSPVRYGMRSSSATPLVSSVCCWRAPFGGPVVPEVRMIVRLSRGAARPLAGSEVANQLFDRGGVVTRRDAGFDRERFEFLVVHEGDRRFAFHYLCELRRGEAGVAIQNVDAELGECAGGVEEETVVAAQHADDVALANPLRRRTPRASASVRRRARRTSAARGRRRLRCDPRSERPRHANSPARLAPQWR